MNDTVVPFQTVLEKEHAAISERRGRAVTCSQAIPERAYGESGAFDTVGLCLSGGGIRSAAFSLGALQALEEKQLIKKIDYLSTVSGGGYIGTAMTATMSANGGDFPYLSQGDLNDTKPVGHIRDNSNFLLPRGWFDMVSNFAIVFRGLISNLIFVAPFILFLVVLTIWANPDLASLDEPGFAAIKLPLSYFSGAFGITLTLFVGALILFAAWALTRAIFKASSSEFQGKMLPFMKWLLVAIVIILFFELQPWLIKQFFRVSQYTQTRVAAPSDLVGWLSAIASFIAPAIAAVSLFSKTIGEMLKTTEAEVGFKALLKRWSSKLIVFAAALALPVLLWIVYLLLCYWGIKTPSQLQTPVWLDSLASTLPPNSSLSRVAQLYLVMAIVGLLLWALLQPNANSLHRLYRDRLEAAFLPSDPSGTSQPLHIGQLDHTKSPYHLINCALNIQGSKYVNQRGRNADFFMFSKFYAGSAATGYVPMNKLETKVPDFDLPTATAISGAAISSNMGSASIRVLAPTLALLNLRLGYWMRNPKTIRHERVRPKLFYLFHEMGGWLTEKSPYVYLTDGGHVENLGLYELLRRRCKFIIAIDAEADPGHNFQALVKLQRYARTDLGIRLRLPWQRIHDVSTKVVSGGAASSNGPHCAVGVIEYSKDAFGHILYVKSSLTGDENDYIRDYAKRYSHFPHETTGDQFFSEEQFEVYRALGFHALFGFLSGRDGADCASAEPQKLWDAGAKDPAIVAIRKELMELTGQKRLKSLRRAKD
jgi:hypothetical protein